MPAQYIRQFAYLHLPKSEVNSSFCFIDNKTVAHEKKKKQTTKLFPLHVTW